MISLRKLLTTEEVSDLLGISKEATWRYVRSRRIPAIHIGRQVRFDEMEILEWLGNGGCGLKERAG
jgi:excisionase family DNA binding protein